MQKFYKASKARLAAVGTGLTLTAGQVLAALPTDAQTALDDMKTDAIAVATVFLVATIAISAFFFMRKAAK